MILRRAKATAIDGYGIGWKRVHVEYVVAGGNAIDAIGAIGIGQAADGGSRGAECHHRSQRDRGSVDEAHGTANRGEVVLPSGGAVEDVDGGHIVGIEGLGARSVAQHALRHGAPGPGVLQAQCVAHFVNRRGIKPFQVAGTRAVVGVVGEDHGAANDGSAVGGRTALAQQAGGQILENHIAAGRGGNLSVGFEAAEFHPQVGRTHRIPRSQRLLHLCQQRTEAIARRVDRRTLVGDKKTDRAARRDVELLHPDGKGTGATACQVVHVVIIGLGRSTHGERHGGEAGKARGAHYFPPPCAARVVAMRDRSSLKLMVSAVSFTGRDVS